MATNPIGKTEFDFRGTPWKHQLTALEMSKEQRDFALFQEMGTGKSYTAVLIARWKMHTHGGAMKVLVVTPLITLDNWVREWTEHSALKARALKGSSERVIEDIKTAKEKVLVINYEKLHAKKGELLAALKEWCPDILIGDEIHKCKDPKTSRSKAMFELSKIAKHRIIMTGTPILNSPMDIFGQFKILDQGASFGLNFFTFRNKYFFDANRSMPTHIKFPNWKPYPSTIDKISKIISKKSIQAKKKDCLDLPPLVRKTISIELSAEQKKAYLEVERDLVTYIGGSVAMANIALVKALRLMQIASGHLSVEDIAGKEKSIHEFSDNPKASALADILSDVAPHHKVLVWCNFKANYSAVRRVCEGLKIPSVEIHGDVPNAEKFKNIDRFNNDPAVRVLIGNPQAGGIGINLVAASYSVNFSRNFSLEHALQSEARNYRGGSEIHDKITQIDLVAKDTIDEAVARALANKEEIGLKVLKEIVGGL
jgi:SNF2 family DNA or RNA helicase